MAKLVSLHDRLWRRVDRDGPTPLHAPDLGACWIWTASTDRFGYGRINLGRRGEGDDRTHRVSYALEHGRVPVGALVLHRCDNPPCVRPSHLFLGTHHDNTQDAKAKGRLRTDPVIGSEHPLATISEADVPQIRAMRARRVSLKSIAKQFGTSVAVVWDVANGRTWKHVP